MLHYCNAMSETKLQTELQEQLFDDDYEAATEETPTLQEQLFSDQ